MMGVTTRSLWGPSEYVTDFTTRQATSCCTWWRMCTCRCASQDLGPRRCAARAATERDARLTITAAPQIFISMLLYFALIAIFIEYVKRATLRHTAWEEMNERHESTCWQRLHRPIADEDEFKMVKEHFGRWVNALSRRSVEDALTPLPWRGARAHAVAGQRADGTAVTIDTRFSFADYLSICMATQIEELVEFKTPTWLTVIAVALLEAGALFLGGEDVAVDAFFSALTLLALVAMWTVSYSRRRAVLKAAYTRRPDAYERQSVRPNYGGIVFVRLLQALMWRNIFWVAVFFLNPQFRHWVRDHADFIEEHGPWRVVVVVITLLTAVAMPYVTFNWAFGTNMPPHVNHFTRRALEQLTLHQAERRASARGSGELPHIAAAPRPGTDHAMAPKEQHSSPTSPSAQPVQPPSTAAAASVPGPGTLSASVPGGEADQDELRGF
mmetsp:Transcript_16970/g.43877  ORF Transcript_16970/g.43877 Transcript_16970/m.43877 type:complete len:441 (-) Transcript_16970:226-1548(-)